MKLFLLLFILISCLSCKHRHCDIVIDCTIKFSQGKYIYLDEIKVYDKIRLDSCFVDENQKCTFCIQTDQPLILQLGTDIKNYLILIVEPNEKVSITADIRNIPTTYEVDGSPSSKLVHILHKHTLKNYALLDTLASIWEKLKYDSEKIKIRDSLDSVAKTVYEDQKSFMLSFVEQNKSSLAAIIALYQSFGQVYLINEFENIDIYENVVNQLIKKYPENEHVLELKSRVNKNKITLREREAILKRLEPGNPTPEISLPNINDEPFSISTLKGHTILIYFWHSKDPVCRKTNFDLLKLYRTYAKYGFTIVWVALDANKEIWRKVVQTEKLPGIHLIDEKEWLSPLVKIFQMQKVPHLILVDKNGIIVKNNILFNEVQQYLYQLYYNYIIAEKKQMNDTIP